MKKDKKEEEVVASGTKRLVVFVIVCLVVFAGYKLFPSVYVFYQLDNVPSGTTTWKEEVILHDGRRIIVERSHTYGRYGEIGQGRMIAKHSIVLKLPEIERPIIWDKEKTLNLLIFDLIGNVAYIAGRPHSCVAFNHWDRPNPPYVFFRYEKNEWKRIPIEEFPEEIKDTNILVNTTDVNKKYKKQFIEEITRLGYLSSETLKIWNENPQKHRRTIIRERGLNEYGGC